MDKKWDTNTGRVGAGMHAEETRVVVCMVEGGGVVDPVVSVCKEEKNDWSWQEC